NPQSAHEQQRGLRALEIERSARPSGHQLPLLRGGQRSDRRRSEGGRRRREVRARDLEEEQLDPRGGHPRPRDADRRRHRAVHQGQRLGPPRVVHESDGKSRRLEFPRERRDEPPHRRRLGFSQDSGLFHRHADLHDRGKGERRDPRRREEGVNMRTSTRVAPPTSAAREARRRRVGGATLLVLLLALPLLAADHNDPNSVNSIFSDVAISAADLYDMFGWPVNDGQSVVLALTFASIPSTGVFDTDMLYRIMIDPAPRVGSTDGERSLGAVLRY